MVRMLPADSTALSGDDRETLLRVARDSIRCGLHSGRPAEVQTDHFPDQLRQHCSTFVTLKVQNRLRGCRGVLTAIRPLVHDVAENAFAAAFRDRRFSCLTDDEFDDTSIRISMLSPLMQMHVDSEAELLSRVRAGTDGLVLQYGSLRGTLLPSMWDRFSTAADFVQCLKVKTGLPDDFWSTSIRVYRYTTESF